MKILLLTNKVPYPPKDGGAIATLSLAVSMAKNGVDISILSFNTDKHYFDINKIPQEITNHLKFYSVDISTKLNPWKALKNFIFSNEPYIAERFVSENYKNKLIELLKKEQFDIIQLEGLYMCSYIKAIRENSNSKIAFRAHNIEHIIWQRKHKNEKNLLLKYYLKTLSKRILKYKLKYLNCYDVLIPITAEDDAFFNKLGNKKRSHVVQTGIDKENYIINKEHCEFPGFFHIGALDWMPNQEGLRWFIENSWKKFQEENPDYHFYVAGRNASEKEINFFNKNNISYLGEVENSIDFINSKSIMIVPLLSGGGMRIKIIEGMALGKVIISTSIGAEGIPVTNGENILIANSPEEIINAMKLVLSDKELFEKISKNAVDFIYKNFDNKIIGEKLINFYKEILQ